MKLSSLISIFALSIITPVLSAQNLKQPRWITSMPSTTTAVGQGTTIEEAKLAAIARLLSNISFESQEGSIKRSLEAKNIPCPDQLPLLAKMIYRSASFNLLNEFENEGSYWAQCKIQNVEETVESVLQMAVTEGSRHLTEAKLYQQEGLIWKAANSYCKGLEFVSPIINRPIIIETGELGESLYEGYSHLFEGIGWLFDYDSFPMEPGQPLPLKISVSSYSSLSNMAVKGVPCYIIGNDRTADYVVSDTLTNELGLVTIDIKKAPNASKFKIQACIDDGILDRALPHNFATDAMLANVRKEIKSVSVEGYSFDPSVFYYLDLDSIEQTAISADLVNAFSQIGWNQTENQEKCDIVIKTNYSQKNGDTKRYGKYYMTTFTCAMDLVISSMRTKQELAVYKQPEMELVLRSDSRSEKVHNRASIELIKRLLPAITSQISSLNFDKRAEVYNRAKDLRK